MAEVRSIFGNTIQENGSVVEVIETLEGLLAEARRGEITAFAMAFLDGNYSSNSQVTGSGGHAPELGAAISMLQYRYYKQWSERTDGCP